MVVEHTRLCLGGTFNPPHLAHFELAHAALKAFKHVSPELFLIPSGQPAQKKLIVSVQHRLRMLELACEDDAKLRGFERLSYPIQIDQLELHQSEPSFTYDTVQTLQKTFPNTRLIWVIGEDQLWNFATWHRYVELIQHIHLAVAVRPGFAKPNGFDVSEWGRYVQTHTCYVDDPVWQKNEGGWIILFHAPQIALSSSSIRDAMRAPEQNKTFLEGSLSQKVQAYIVEQALYI